MEYLIFAISLLFSVVYTALMMYYRKGWMAIPTFKRPGNTPSITKISIIVPARNEAANIAVCLNSIVNQSYPKNLFEVLVVDDHSTDQTAEIIRAYPDVKLIVLKDFIGQSHTNAYKKKAIEIAIQQSTGQLIVTTDADCIAPENWLAVLAAFYEEKKPVFIVMPVLIRCTNRWIEIFQSLDFMTLQGITGASVYKKTHSMCNGANLAYTREAFNAVDGFKGIDTIASGDDMLLLHKIYTLYPNGIAYLKSSEVIVETQPVKSLGEFFNQRIRWASKADQYDDKRIFAVLMLVYFFNVWILLLVVGLFFFSIANLLIITLVTKTLVELVFLSPVASFFNQTKLLKWFPMAQPLHVLYTIVAGWLGKFGTYQWKERKVS